MNEGVIRSLLLLLLLLHLSRHPRKFHSYNVNINKIYRVSWVKTNGGRNSTSQLTVEITHCVIFKVAEHHPTLPNLRVPALPITSQNGS